ncbi:MAG: hypothetical protein RIT27_1936 [Pseudomonadota bacterium]|jgi:hypothetical protein
MTKIWKIALWISLMGIIGALLFATHYQKWVNLIFLNGITSGQAFILMLVSLEITILGFGAAAVGYLWQKFSSKK